jgi:hypothetical protein
VRRSPRCIEEARQEYIIYCIVYYFISTQDVGGQDKIRLPWRHYYAGTKPHLHRRQQRATASRRDESEEESERGEEVRRLQLQGFYLL